jgi:hypothetical protein
MVNKIVDDDDDLVYIDDDEQDSEKKIKEIVEKLQKGYVKYIRWWYPLINEAMGGKGIVKPMKFFTHAIPSKIEEKKEKKEENQRDLQRLNFDNAFKEGVAWMRQKYGDV